MKFKSTLFSLLLISACGSHKSEHREDRQEENNPEDTFLDDSRERKSSEVYTMSYRFNQNGCDTEKQEFKSDNRVDVLRQMCDGLQNEALNRRCALESRKRFFDEKCKGYRWR